MQRSCKHFSTLILAKSVVTSIHFFFLAAQPGDSIVVKRTHALSSIEAYNDQDESMDSTMETLAVSSSSANNSEIKSENTSSPMEIDGATNDGLEIDTSTSSSSGTPGPTWSIVINSGSLENNDTHEKESNSVPGTPSVVPSENIPDDFISETWTVDEDSRKGRKQDVKCADRLCSNVGDTIRESVSKASAQHNGNQILCSGKCAVQVTSVFNLTCLLLELNAASACICICLKIWSVNDLCSRSVSELQKLQ